MRNPPVTASPCQPPLGKGAMGTGVRIATASVRTGLAMTLRRKCGGAAGHMGPALRMFFQIKKENAGGVLLTA